MIVAWKPDSVVSVQLRKHIKHLIKCFFSYPNTSNFVKSTPLYYVFRNPAELLTCLFLPFFASFRCSYFNYCMKKASSDIALVWIAYVAYQHLNIPIVPLDVKLYGIPITFDVVIHHTFAMK